MINNAKIMPLDELISFVSRVHRSELSDALEFDRCIESIQRNKDYEAEFVLSKYGISVMALLDTSFLYTKAIRVTLVETGWDARWVESVVRTLLDNSYLPVEPMEEDAAELLAGEFRRFYPSEDDAEIIDKLVAARFNVHELL